MTTIRPAIGGESICHTTITTISWPTIKERKKAKRKKSKSQTIRERPKKYNWEAKRSQDR